MIEVRALTEANRIDAEEVIRRRFPESALKVLIRAMRNPLSSICQEYGDVAYENGKPVAFQAVTLRKGYLGPRQFVGHVSGLAALAEGASFRAVMAIRKAAHFAQKRRGNAQIRFGNSHCESTEQLAKVMKRQLGPESCTRFLWRAIRPLDCALYFLRRKVFKASMPKWPDFDTRVNGNYTLGLGDLCCVREMNVCSDVFDTLMRRHLAANEGLVISRTGEEVQWIFGDRISSGRCVLLVAYLVSLPAGYIILDGGGNGRRWMILDWFAAGNGTDVLEFLLKAACDYLRKRTPAMMLETVGFPMFVQGLLKHYLPFVRKVGNNRFSYNYPDQFFGDACEKVIHSEKSWFFGPYDGDICF